MTDSFSNCVSQNTQFSMLPQNIIGTKCYSTRTHKNNELI